MTTAALASQMTSMLKLLSFTPDTLSMIMVSRSLLMSLGTLSNTMAVVEAAGDSDAEIETFYWHFISYCFIPERFQVMEKKNIDRFVISSGDLPKGLPECIELS